MTEYERVVWALAYAAAIMQKSPDYARTADAAVIDFQKAEQRFNADFPTPPEEWEDEDLPF